MRYLLDSDSLSELYRPDAPGHAAITRRVATLQEAEKIDPMLRVEDWLA